MKQKIEKYFNGETTNREEEEINNYFRAGNIDPELKEYAKYFLGMASLKFYSKDIIPEEEYADIQVNRDEIPPEIMKYISEIGRNVAHNVSTQSKNRHFMDLQFNPKIAKRIAIPLAIAASFVLLILLFPLWNTNNNLVAINGAKYTDKALADMALHTSLNNVKLDMKQMFDNFDSDL
jgi:hypothetical protein